MEVWVKELSGNRRAVALLNRSDRPADISFTGEEIGLSGKRRVRDLWSHRDLGFYEDAYTGKDVVAHDARVLLVQ